MHRDRAGKDEPDAVTVRPRLLGGETEQVERASHVHLVRRFGRELGPRAQEGGEVVDLRDLVHGQEPAEERPVADVAHVRLQAPLPDR